MDTAPTTRGGRWNWWRSRSGGYPRDRAQVRRTRVRSGKVCSGGWQSVSLRSTFHRFVRGVGFTALALLLAGIGGWGALLLEYAGPRSDRLRTALVVGFALAAV